MARKTLVLLIVPFVIASSWLGLNGLATWLAAAGSDDSSSSSAWREQWRFFVEVWSASVLADAAFAIGMAAVGVAGFRLAQRGWTAPAGGTVRSLGVAGAAVAAAALTWLVYTVSFLLLPDDLSGVAWDVGDVIEAASFVGSWGVTGIAFSGIAAAAAGAIDARRAAPAPGWKDPPKAS